MDIDYEQFHFQDVAKFDLVNNIIRSMSYHFWDLWIHVEFTWEEWWFVDMAWMGNGWDFWKKGGTFYDSVDMQLGRPGHEDGDNPDSEGPDWRQVVTQVDVIG